MAGFPNYFSNREIDNTPCPECGSPMIEVDRQIENQITFIWYECVRPDCDGQWLQRKSIPCRKGLTLTGEFR